MTYNIFNGGKGRLPLIIKTIKAENPDYLTILEANTFVANSNKFLKTTAKKLSFPHCDIALSGEYDYHVAIFSKYPFQNVKKIKHLKRACLITKIDTEVGTFKIASAHFSPANENERLVEIERIMNALKGKNIILMGDMNSLSRIDDYDLGIIKNFNNNEKRKFTSNKGFRFDVTDKILKNGFCDPAVELQKNKEYTTPTKIPNEDKSVSKLRLDYIFLSKSLLPNLNNYTVIKNTVTEKASDHYPVTVSLKKTIPT